MSDTYENWSLERDADGVAWLRLDCPGTSTNVLSRSVLNELESLLTELEKELPRALILYSGKDNGFVAGADVTEFPNISTEAQAYEVVRLGQRIFDRLEQLTCASAAVINGFALGGGLELALACDYRIAFESDERTMGLPEVQLGVHPGFGGSVRMVRLIGVRQALQLMLTGKSVRPDTARRIGLIDQISNVDDWRSAALHLVDSRRARSTAPLLDRILNLSVLRPLVASVLVKQTKRQAKPEHYPAPFAIIDLWVKHGADVNTGMEAEARSFARLIETPTSKNLVRVFFLQDRLKQTASKDIEPARRVHVVGAGVMGGDIAAWCALRGLEVTLQDREDKYISPAIERAEALFAKRLKNPANLEAARERLRADVAGDGVANADVIIEAIFEDLDAKQALHRDLERRMRPTALLSTNTSSIPLDQIAASLESPSRLVGLHFFNPVARMPLIEVVHIAETDPVMMNAGIAFAKQIGKLPLPTASSPGFLVNRVLAPYMGEAIQLIDEGVSATDIDRAAKDFGMPMGPVELADSVGLDIALHVAEIVADTIGREMPGRLRQLVEQGHLGLKTGRGFYTYKEGRPEKARSSSPASRSDVQDRLMMSLINEAAACLGDNVVGDVDLVDAGVIFGTGFAPFRGGPLHYAEETGIDNVLSTLERLEQQYGQRFRAGPGWQKISR